MPMLDYALAYARAGRAVFPCQRNGKLPAISKEQGGQGCKDATTDEATIRQWWAHYLNANIGLATGPVIVLDIDTKKGGDGMEFIARYMSAMPPTRLVQTPSGGVHFYFDPGDQHFGNRTRIQGHSIDLRGYGGYVLAPPSVVGGKAYEVIGGGERVAPAPAWLIELLRPPARQKRERATLDGSIEGLAGFVERAAEGERNSRLFWAACRAFDQDLTVDALVSAAREAGLDEPEIMRTIGSASNPKYRRPVAK